MINFSYFLATTNQTKITKRIESFQTEVKFIKITVPNWFKKMALTPTKTRLYMGLIEYYQVDFLFQELSEILRQNYPNLEAKREL